MPPPIGLPHHEAYVFYDYLYSYSTNAGSLPHIVFVLIDDMGYNDFIGSSDMEPYWSTARKLADEGIVLQDYYTMHMWQRAVCHRYHKY